MTRLALLCALGLLALAQPAHAIVNGTRAAQGDFRFLARSSGVPCTGTLVAPNRVLTAAHGVQGANPADLGAITVGGMKATRRAVAMVSDPRYVEASIARKPEA